MFCEKYELAWQIESEFYSLEALFVNVKWIK